MICALVPVKSLSAGKSRLAPVLPGKEREALSVYMLGKVLDALLLAERFHWIGVVTDDPRVEAVARERAVHTLREDGAIDENRSIAYGSRICREMGAHSLLVIHADLPLVTAGDIQTLLSKGGGAAKIVLCPSKEGTGTNALYRTPPEVIPACFGPGSFSRHVAEAAARKIPWEKCSLPGIAVDLDTPEDLEKLRRRPGLSSFAPRPKETRVT
jgi:2-phospho-L-lactate guanylyltransferase